VHGGPEPQAQPPSVQRSLFSSHARPQFPQFLKSVIGSVQPPLQQRMPAVQGPVSLDSVVQLQTPFVQSSATWLSQAIRHPPQ
jgi:hypothetical protein